MSPEDQFRKAALGRINEDQIEEIADAMQADREAMVEAVSKFGRRDKED